MNRNEVLEDEKKEMEMEMDNLPWTGISAGKNVHL